MMAAEYFNSLGGYSAGIPAVPVVDANGNVITNVNTNGNVFANVIYATYYRFANGQPFNPSPGGNNTQLQYNNNGSFAGIPNVTWNGNILNLGTVDKLSIGGGLNGYFLQTDGTGNLTWSPAGNGGGGNGSPGGSNAQVQFNDEGNFGGDAGFVYNKTTDILSVNNVTVSANVTANKVYATGNITANYFIGNGSQLTGILVNSANYVSQPVQANITSLGTLTSLNVAGNISFASSGNVSLGSVSNIHISGGLTGYVLTTDGTGNLSWESAGGGSGSPGGSNTQLQFNDGGSFGGSAAFTFNKVSNAVVLTGNVTTKNLTSNSQTVYGNVNISGNATAGYYFGDGSYLTNVQSDVANYVAQPAQSNITSLGTLTSLNVIGNIITSQYVSAAQIQTSGNANVGTLRVSSSASITGQLTANGIISFTASPNVSLGSVANVRISGGLNGYVLSTDGLGTLSWQPQGGGGGGSPGGSNTQIQFNNSGVFAGSPFFTFDDATDTVQVGGQLIANSMQIGSGAYKFASSFVYFATTASTSRQVIYSIPVSECSGAEFDIIGTDSIGQQRQSVKISSVYYAGIVQYNEYAGLYVNGGVGSFEVSYNPGNILVPPSLDLAVTPDSANNTVYKMWITILAP
jgi:hypothetical protein